MPTAEFAVPLRRAVEFLLLPPALPLWGIALGLTWARWRPRAGHTLAWIGLVVALLTSAPVIGQWSIAQIERDAGAPLDAASLRALLAAPNPPTAIVILGGGLRSDPRERPEVDSPNSRTTERVLHGAWVARVTGLPVLVSGGKPASDKPAEAALMKRMLESRLATAVKWVEDRSRDTAGNAEESAALLRAAGHRRILLVTHAYHMPRAKASFEHAGLHPVPVAHGYLGTPDPTEIRAWLPSAHGVEIAWLAAHEGVGGLWYRLRGPIGEGFGATGDWFDGIGAQLARSFDEIVAQLGKWIDEIGEAFAEVGEWFERVLRGLS